MVSENTPKSGGETNSHRYDAGLAQRIEVKWQGFWAEREIFRAPNPGEPGWDPGRPKKFVMDMFPYPSGVGLHVGHPLGYIATDIYARFLRMTGHNVLHPMGFDAFGLPAEQFAIQTGQHPRVTTERNIATMRRQMRRLGLGHDPRRFLATTDASFYQWTQWIFLRIFESWYDRDADRARPIAELVQELESGKRDPSDAEVNPEGRSWSELDEVERRRIVDHHRLAYLARIPVNWCPALGTVLANEEVTAEGRSERGNHPVYKRPLEQWMMRITEYCERLLRDLEPLDWPEPIKLMQRNWIGRSEGAEVDFLALLPGTENVVRWFSSRKKDGFPPRLPEGDTSIRVFTTRPDTLYGATYMVLSPEHPLVDRLVADEWPVGAPAAHGRFPGCPTGDATPRELVEAYRRFAASRSDVERQVETREKTGVFLGSFAANPVSGERVPIFIADYVLMGYGTGAIMAVPGHDTRDFEFARQFGLPVVPVVLPPVAWLRETVPAAVRYSADIDLQDAATLAKLWTNATRDEGEPGGSFELPAPFIDEGTAINSEVIDGMSTPAAKARITDWLAERGLGRRTIHYRLRDWLFSRQRYWGEPFPIIYDEHGLPVAVDEKELPVELPDVDDYTPEVSDDPDTPPTPPLARAREWAEVTIAGKRYRRELNTMPNWAGSCWYYLRYLDPRNEDRFAARDVERFWMLTPEEGEKCPESWSRDTCRIGGVDLYVGGAEHAVLHLLYSRFWHKVLFDLGHVSTPEPFHRLFNQGYVQAAAYTDARGVYVEAAKVEERDGRFFYEGEEVRREFGKMGKSLKNALTPDDICESYGADTLRLYEMYMGPLDASKPWNTRDIIGVYRFLQRLWRNLVDEDTGTLRVSEAEPPEELHRLLHRTIDGVRRDMTALGFNTAIAKLIELNNALTPLDSVPRSVAEPLVLLLAPLAPHIAEELWSKLRPESATVAYEPYPEADEEWLVEDNIELPVMIRGKVRAHIRVAADATTKEMESAALEHPRVREQLEGLVVKKVIAVPGKLVNIVV